MTSTTILLLAQLAVRRDGWSQEPSCCLHLFGLHCVYRLMIHFFYLLQQPQAGGAGVTAWAVARSTAETRACDTGCLLFSTVFVRKKTSRREALVGQCMNSLRVSCLRSDRILLMSKAVDRHLSFFAVLLYVLASFVLSRSRSARPCALANLSAIRQFERPAVDGRSTSMP